jgi:hypothetical protein
MYQPPSRTRRRLWPIFIPITLIIALAVIWTGIWFYAAAAAETAIDGWRAREARSGRTYECGTQTIGGYPFRIEVRCSNPNAELRGKRAQLVLKGADLVMLAQVYDPTLLIGEFSGPMTVAEPGQSPAYVVNWTLGQSSVRGTPRAPQRGSLVFDNLVVQRPGEGAATAVLNAKRIELHGRMAEGSAADNPVIDVALRATAAAAPELHPQLAAPLDADIAATLRGLADFAPKPWADRFKEMQARGGRIDITNARVQQGDVVLVGTGTLGLTERGNLDGQLQVTVVGIEQLINSLDLERVVSQGSVSAAIDRLDRLLPGLGKVARKNAAPGILAGLDVFGKRTTLEGKPAVAVPVRFVDGRIMLGPFPVGSTPPLF